MNRNNSSSRSKASGMIHFQQNNVSLRAIFRRISVKICYLRSFFSLLSRILLKIHDSLAQFYILFDLNSLKISHFKNKNPPNSDS